MLKPTVLIAAIAAALGVEGAAEASQQRARADIVNTTLRDAAGAARGTAALYQRGQEIRVEVVFREASPGAVHGVHLHRIGLCEGPDFVSAGEHWNPYEAKHGSANPDGPHAGDLPNLTIGPDGVGRIDVLIDGIALTEGQPPLVNMGAIVVHADADDMKTDPSGASGARIACGAFGGADPASPSR